MLLLILYTVLLDVSVPSLNEREIAKKVDYMIRAFERYAKEDDHTTIITFDSKHAEVLTQKTSNLDKKGLYALLHQIKWTIGCADWTVGLSVLKGAGKRVLFVADENPCGPDPSHLAYQLHSDGYDILAVGIGHVSKQWLSVVGQKVITIGNPEYLKRFSPIQQQRDMVVEEPLSAGEIVTVVIIGLLFFIVFLACCCVSCREPEMKPRRQYKV